MNFLPHALRFWLFFPLTLQLGALGQDPPPDFSNLSLKELSTIKVTSVSKKQQSLSQVAAAVYVISQEEIHRSGMTTVADLLRQVPGLTVARLDSSKWAVTSRGFNGRFANKLLVMVDGRSIYTPIFSGVYWDMAMPLLDDINRIEVIRGPGASIWGANAVAGVINIITKSAKEISGVSVTAGGGTAERAFGQVRFGGTAAQGISYRGYLSGSDRTGSPVSGGQTARDGWSDTQGGFRIDGTTRDGGWQLEGDLYRNRRQEIGDLPSPQAGYAPVLSHGDYTGLSSSLAFEWRRHMTETSDLRVTASYGFVNRPETGVSVAESRTADFEVQYRFVPAKHHELSVGLGDRLITDLGSSTGSVSFNPSRLAYQLTNGFAQDEIHLLNDRVLLTLGAKLEHDLFGGWQLQPTVRALWAPNKHHSLWVAASRAARTPAFDERSSSAVVASEPPSASAFGLPVVVSVNGSTQYQPEILKAYELGYRAQLTPRLSIDVAGFYDDYAHLKTESPTAPILIATSQPYLSLPVFYSNLEKGQGFGGEISSVYHPFARWKLAGSYSYLNLHSQYLPNAPPDTVDASSSASPGNQGKLQSYFNLTQALQLDSFLFSSSSVALPEFAMNRHIVLPPHTRIDVRLGWKVTPRIEVSLSGQDLLSPRHIELTPEALTPPENVGRGYYLKTTWRF